MEAERPETFTLVEGENVVKILDDRAELFLHLLDQLVNHFTYGFSSTVREIEECHMLGEGNNARVCYVHYQSEDLRRDIRSWIEKGDFSPAYISNLPVDLLARILQLRESSSLLNPNYWSSIEFQFIDLPPIPEIVISTSRQIWDEIIREATDNPAVLRELPSRRFEEFTAELLARHGFEVELTAPQKDGGVDIFAKKEDLLGKHVYAIECKNPPTGRPIDVRIVRQLLGSLEFLNRDIKACAIFTTSRFTVDADELQRQRPSSVYLHDLKKIRAWLQALNEIRKD